MKRLSHNYRNLIKRYFKLTTYDHLAYFGLLLLGIVMVFFRFNQIPRYLAYDELEFAKIALALDVNPWQIFTNYATGHSTLYFHVIRIFFVLFGVSNFVLRLPSALVTIAIPLIWVGALKSAGISRKLAFLSGLFLAGERVFFQFGRFAFEGNFLLFLELLSFYFLLQFIFQKSMKSFFLSNIFCILAFYSYTPGRIFVIVPLVTMWICRANIKSYLQKIGHYLLGWMLGIVPLVLAIARIGDERVTSLSILSQDYLSFTQKIFWHWVSLGKFLMQWHFIGDGNARHNYAYRAFFNDISGVLFLLGIAIWWRNRQNKFHQLLFFYTLVVSLPTLLVLPFENPSFLRIVGLFPVLAYLCALGAHKLALKIKNSLENWTIMQPIRKIINRININIYYFVVIIVFTASLFWNIKIYFRDQARQMDDAFRVAFELGDFGKEKLIPLDLSLPEFFARQ